MYGMSISSLLDARTESQLASGTCCVSHSSLALIFNYILVEKEIIVNSYIIYFC